MITVTKPFQPPKENFDKYLQGIWRRNWLTNNGPLVNELETKLKQYFDLRHAIFLSNGTIALQIAIKALKLTGEIITTPFSYVATTSTIYWENCKPIFAEIDEDSFNISPDSIPNYISKNTSAILATHCFGNPCDIEKLEKISKKYNLKIIYDAAHCFGTFYKGKSIFSYGNISTSSFHATKMFHTIEGGAIFTSNSTLAHKTRYLRNFGHNGQEDFFGLGINGKNSEVHAAMGLCNIEFANSILETRKRQWEYYKKSLENGKVKFQKLNEQGTYNYAYFPIVFESERELLKVKKELEKHLIYSRRYFYPSLNKLPYIKNVSRKKSERLASTILCLPLYHTLSVEEQDMICGIISKECYSG